MILYGICTNCYYPLQQIGIEAEDGWIESLLPTSCPRCADYDAFAYCMSEPLRDRVAAVMSADRQIGARELEEFLRPMLARALGTMNASGKHDPNSSIVYHCNGMRTVIDAVAKHFDLTIDVPESEYVDVYSPSRSNDD